MKKFFRLMLFLAILGIGGGGAYLYFQNQVQIPHTMVQTAVNAKFPMEKSYPFGKIKLYSPKTHFENDRLIIEAEYLNDALNDKISGTMTFETDIKYDLMEAKLYLDDFKLIEVTKEGKNIDMSKKPIIRTALNFAFGQLEKKELVDLKQIEKFQMIKDIKIENNKLIVVK